MILRRNAIEPQYASPLKRKESFVLYTKLHPTKVDEIVEAGMFYPGIIQFHMSDHHFYVYV